MNKVTTVLLAALTVSCLWAKEGATKQMPKNAPAPRLMQRPMMQNQGAWLARMLAKKENFDKLGIKDAKKADMLYKQLNAIQKEEMALMKKMQELTRSQAMMMRQLFANQEINEKEILGKADQIAKVKAAQGRLALKAIIELRKNLTDEQMKAARQMIMMRARQRMQRLGDQPREGGRRQAKKALAPAEGDKNTCAKEGVKKCSAKDGDKKCCAKDGDKKCCAKDGDKKPCKKDAGKKKCTKKPAKK
jgi:hypothetical protein